MATTWGCCEWRLELDHWILEGAHILYRIQAPIKYPTHFGNVYHMNQIQNERILLDELGYCGVRVLEPFSYMIYSQPGDTGIKEYCKRFIKKDLSSLGFHMA